MSHPKELQERKFGELAVEFGYVSQESLLQALRQQHRLAQQEGRLVPLGEVLRLNGALTDRQSKRILGLQTGCQKLGQYVLVRKLGSGGMGSVYEARQEMLNRPVAVKILAQHIARNAVAIEQFHREAQLVAKLDHPNIVAGIDVGVDQGVHYFAMELVPGSSLGQILLGGKRMRLDKALRLLQQVAKGLAHAHSRGVIHRDIKPGNILVYKDTDSSNGHSTAKITDLGLAQTRLLTAEDRRNIGWNMGTPHYFAPEQARGDHAQDFRVDIYALGMTFYRLLTGREPFEGMPYHAIRDAHVTSTLINPLDHVKEKLPLNASLVLRKMTAKDPRDRFASYDELLEGFDAIYSGHTYATPALGPDAATIRPPLERFKARGARTTTISGSRLSAAKVNGKSHLTKLPSGFLERYNAGLDAQLKARAANPLRKIKPPTRIPPPTPHGPSSLPPAKGSAILPTWLVDLLRSRDEANRNG